MELPYTKSAIEKLGKNLAAAGTVSTVADEDMDRLATLSAVYGEVQTRVAVLLGNAGLNDVSGRPGKLPQSIIDKLIRDKTRLNTMQDIAGLRIVRRATLPEQTRLGRLIDKTLTTAGCRVDWGKKDRRDHPSFGYRALHLVAYFHDIPVEIQVRTWMQNIWAQIIEALEDQFGRQIRYGESPVGGAYAERVMSTLHRVSATIRAVEEQRALLDFEQTRWVIETDVEVDESIVANVEERLEHAETLLREHLEELARSFGVEGIP